MADDLRTAIFGRDCLPVDAGKLERGLARIIDDLVREDRAARLREALERARRQRLASERG